MSGTLPQYVIHLVLFLDDEDCAIASSAMIHGLPGPSRKADPVLECLERNFQILGLRAQQERDSGLDPNAVLWQRWPQAGYHE